MNPSPERVQLLRAALLHAPAYFTLEDPVRAACKRFLGLAATVDPEDSHAVARVEGAYDTALAEARSLVAEGRLVLDEGHPLPSGTMPNVAADPYPLEGLSFGAGAGDGGLSINGGQDAENVAVDVPGLGPTAPVQPVSVSHNNEETPATESVLQASPEIVGTIADPTSEITRLHDEIGAAFTTSLERAIRIGELLTHQKAMLVHGKFLPWVREKLPFTERTAQNYMRVYAKRNELKSATVADLAGAYRLAASGETKPERPEAPERTADDTPEPDDGTNLAGNSPSQTPCQHQAECPNEDQPRASDDPAVKTETVNVGVSDPHSLAQQEGDVSPYPPPTSEQATPAVMSLGEAFAVLVRAVRSRGPKLARRAIEQLGVEARLNVFVPLDADPEGNLMLLEDIVAEQLAAADPRHARQWVRSLGSLLSDQEDVDDDDDDDFD